MLSTLVAPLLALGSFAAPGFANEDPGFDWQGKGKAFLAAHDSLPIDAGLIGFLDSEYFAHVALGSFDLYIPVEQLRDAEQAELFREFSMVALDIQDNWHRWRSTDLGTTKPSEDWKALKKWVEGWKAKKMASIVGGAEPINEQIKGGDKLVELQKRLAANGQTNPKMEEYLGQRNKLVFAPRRQDFLEILAVAGILEKDQQKNVWDDANLKRTAAWVGWVELLCFVECGYPFEISQPYLSQSMNREEPTAQSEFIADRMVLQLLRKEFYPNGTHFFELSLGTNLVIETLGYNNARSGDWSVSYQIAGATTQPYERFVPGGNAAGGVLPPRRAIAGPATGSATEISRYRKQKGENFFLESLKLSQKEGTKLAKGDNDNPLAKNKLAHFVLHSFENGDDTVISAPFLGPLADAKKLPANEFIDDYEDFFRAYRSGFFHWLIENGDANKTKAIKQFSTLIDNQASRPIGTSFESVIEAVYGVPLSAADDSADSLEWRYLAWLKKAK